ncbi:MAG: PDZ domain-containing protein [Phycisphaerales bacterium]
MPLRTRAAAMLIASAGISVPCQSLTAQPPVTAESAVKLSEGATDTLLRDGLRNLISGARDKVFPSLVNISVITVNYYGGVERKGGGTGSGTIISKDGHVVTNAHVTSSGKKFKVTLADKSEISAELVGEDPQTDLAVLKLSAEDLKGRALPVAGFGDSDELAMGDYVIAMGSPYSLSRSITLGVVSNCERVFAGGNEEVGPIDYIDGQATGSYTRWIQHDALINPGNSGGPLVNLKGQIVGVNTRGGSGMGFASPSNMVKDIVAKLIAHGEVPRSQVGFSLKQIEKSGLKEGVLITSVIADAPAGKAGIKAGDVIVKMDGTPVTARFAEEIPALTRRIADTAIGGKIRLTVQRAGETKEFEVTTEKMLKDKGDETILRGWGLGAEDVTEAYARELRLTSRDGVLVTGVRGGSPPAHAEPSLQGGDIITTLDGKPLKNLAEIVERYKAIMAMEPIPEFLMIGVERRGKNQVTLIKPRPVKREDPPREVPKAWIGMETQPVLKDLARQLGHDGQTGFRVTRVYPKTLAAGSELKVGDVIVSLNNEKTAPKGMQDAGFLRRQIEKIRLEDGAKATLKVLRAGQPVDVTVPVERTRIGPEEARKDDNKDFELGVRELTFFDRDDNRWDDDVTGVMVTGAEPAGWAGLGGLFGGDLIQRIDSETITDLTSYRAAMEKITKAQSDRVTFVVLRGVRTFYKFVEPDWKPLVDKKKAEQVEKEKKEAR